jgi:hypothetical protein
MQNCNNFVALIRFSKTNPDLTWSHWNVLRLIFETVMLAWEADEQSVEAEAV